MLATFAALVLLLTVYFQGAAGAKHSTALSANSVFGDVITVKMAKYRQLASVAPVKWDDGLAGQAAIQANNCGLLYDYWASPGQIIFRIGRQDNKDVDIINSTYFAVDHWWDLRKNYNPKSDEYDELQPFYGSWEFTQMVWQSNTLVGCAWSPIDCIDAGLPEEQNPGHLVDHNQMVCLLSPGGNKWEEWGANVHCPDCAAEPQTETINPATITFETQTAAAKRTEVTKRAALDADAHWDAELERIEAYRTLPLEEFYPGYTMSPKATTQVTASPTPAPTSSPVVSVAPSAQLSKRATPPSFDDPDFHNAIVNSVNAFREKHGVTNKVEYNTTMFAFAQAEAVDGGSNAQGDPWCKWPITQEATEIPQFNWAWWVTDDTTVDYYGQFDLALHFWEVWGNGTSFINSLWSTWYDQLVSPNTESIGCFWSDRCDHQFPQGAYQLWCAAGPKVPVRHGVNPVS